MLWVTNGFLSLQMPAKNWLQTCWDLPRRQICEKLPLYSGMTKYSFIEHLLYVQYQGWFISVVGCPVAAKKNMFAYFERFVLQNLKTNSIAGKDIGQVYQITGLCQVFVSQNQHYKKSQCQLCQNSLYQGFLQ
eukprot:TRINITY_DN4638_c0_g1_i1.p5 TRINITY_DN4638_c0_g1~~TRINITY_DN4638_c0_g1_i1.p5  ORF type:complete len:133 (-),score=4.80 TRINITY_DN4638_c0_g1_i1:674-1072(-)